jgi:hypothetical protein
LQFLRQFLYTQLRCIATNPEIKLVYLHPIRAFFDGRGDGTTSPDMFVTIASQLVIAVDVAVYHFDFSAFALAFDEVSFHRAH